MGCQGRLLLHYKFRFPLLIRRRSISRDAAGWSMGTRWPAFRICDTHRKGMEKWIRQET